MKKVLCFLILCFGFIEIYAQDFEWMTSLDVAKRMALTQDKMLFVMWEEAALDLQTITIRVADNKYVTVDVDENDNVDQVIWEHFVPVKLSERHYEELYLKIKGKRKLNYINKFNDDSVKIMDANGNILNTKVVEQFYTHIDLYDILDKYALNTFFINSELRNYSQVKNFATTFRLASKYMDYASLQSKIIEKELLGLSLIYLNEAKELLNTVKQEDRMAFAQKCELLRIYQYAVTDKPRRILRELKRLDQEQIYDVNESKFNFLNYLAYSLLEDEEEIAAWKSKVSLVDLKKGEFITNRNL